MDRQDPTAWAEPYVALLGSLPDLAWLKDRESRYLAANDAFLRHLRDDARVGPGAGPLCAESIRGKRDGDLFCAALAEEYRSHELRVQREGRERRFRIETPLHDGTSRCFEVALAPLRDPAGRVVGTLGTARELPDASARERLESLAALLSGTVHELSGPLSTILNFAQLLLMDPRPEDDAEALAVVRREAERAVGIVAELRGIARRASDPEGGPAAREPQMGAPGIAPGGRGTDFDPRDAPPLRVLVVDDEASIRGSVKRFLERRGHRVDAACDGAEALTLLLRQPPGAAYDVILSDLRMPGLGGEQLLERLRQRGDGLDERVVFVTGDAARGEANPIPGAARAPVLLKPVCLLELTRVVEGLGREGLPPA